VVLLHRSLTFTDFNFNNSSTTIQSSTHSHLTSKMDNPPKIPSGYADRTLRIIMLFAFVPALPLLLAAGIVWLPFPAIGLIPMTISLAINISALKNPKSLVRRNVIADAIVALALLAVMAWRFVLGHPFRGMGKET